MSTSFLAKRQSWVGSNILKYKILTSLEFERSIKMGPVDFIASLGGLFGLFLGFSIISFVEIIYWSVVRGSRMMLQRKK